MVSQKFLVTLLAAYLASAVPLNINLGAYSPALVVGDGEISFGGSPERASEILQTLATGAENGAVPVGQTAPVPSQPAGGELGQKAAGGTVITPAKKLARRSAVDVEERDAGVAKRDIDGFREALNFARDALLRSPGLELRTGITQKPGRLNVREPTGTTQNEKRSVGDDKLGLTLIAISEV